MMSLTVCRYFTYNGVEVEGSWGREETVELASESASEGKKARISTVPAGRGCSGSTGNARRGGRALQETSPGVGVPKAQGSESRQG